MVLAVAGSAVGLGNFLRFPGLAAKYGGGVFLIPYFIAILLIGIPICWVEWSIGRRGGRRGFNSAPGIFRAATGWKNGHFLGVLAVLVPLVVYMYYVYIEAWCMAYAWYYATGQLSLGPQAEAYARFFESLVGTTANGSASHIESPVLIALAASVALNLWLIYRGITRGIEAFCRIAMPVLVLCAVIVLIRVLTLGTPDPAFPEQNVLNGLGFMWNPKIAAGETLLGMLANPEIWLQATGQVFFSVSIGFGIIISYSSYVGPDDDIVLSGLTSASTNEFCELCLGGLITIPAAFIFLGPAPVEKVAGSTFGLGFYTLPVVFEHMPWGAMWGFLWFFLLFLAAVTSSISMLQPVLAFLEEGLALSRARAVAILGAITACGTGLVVHFSRDLTALDAMDFWVGTGRDLSAGDDHRAGVLVGDRNRGRYPGDPARRTHEFAPRVRLRDQIRLPDVLDRDLRALPRRQRLRLPHPARREAGGRNRDRIRGRRRRPPRRSRTSCRQTLARRGGVMTGAGWLLMLVSCGSVTAIVVFCYVRLLRDDDGSRGDGPTQR